MSVALVVRDVKGYFKPAKVLLTVPGTMYRALWDPQGNY